MPGRAPCSGFPGLCSAPCNPGTIQPGAQRRRVRVTPVVRVRPIPQAGAEQMWWHLFLVLICIPLAASQVEQLSTRSPSIWSSSPVKCPLTSHASFSRGLSACLFFISSKILDSGGRTFVSKILHYLLPVCSLPFHVLNFLLMNRSA